MTSSRKMLLRSLFTLLLGLPVLSGCLMEDDVTGPDDETSAKQGTRRWEKIFEYGNSWDVSVRSTRDGGGILCFTDNPTMRLIRLTPAGDVQWERSFGNPVYAAIEGIDCVETVDGGFVMIGNGMTPTQAMGVYAAKTDAGGNIEWQRIFLTQERRTSASITAESGGTFVYCGTINNDQTGAIHPNIVKLDHTGRVLWDRSIILGGYGAAVRLWTMSGTGFALSVEIDAIFRDLLHLGADGTLTSQQRIGTLGSTMLDIYDVDMNGTILVGGVRVDSTGGQNWSVIRKTDAGDILAWEYIGKEGTSSSSGCILPDGGVGALINTHDAYSRRVIRLDDRGELVWQYDAGEGITIVSMCASPDGSIIIAGRYQDSAWDPTRLMVAKIIGSS